MANSAQARKRARQAAKANVHNSALRSKLRTAIKATRRAIEAGDTSKASEVFRHSCKTIDIIADKDIIHKNKASRHKSRLAAALKRCCRQRMLPEALEYFSGLCGVMSRLAIAQRVCRSTRLARKQLFNGLSFPYQIRLCARYPHFCRAGTCIVVGTHHKTVSARAVHGQQVAGLYREPPRSPQPVAALTDRASDIVQGWHCVLPLNHGGDIMVRLIHRWTH